MTATTQAITPPPPPPATFGRLVSPGWLTRSFGVWVTVDRRDQMRWLTVVTGITIGVALLSAALGHIPYTLPMPSHVVGAVCPTCGLTRGTVAIVNGHFGLAFRYNPLSFVVPVIVVAAVVRAIAGALGRGSWLNVHFRPTRLALAAIAIGLVGLWIYQQSHAGFIMGSHQV